MRMLKNSALPGTNWGRIQRFSWLGFFPSRFSQLYSSRPMRLMSASSFSSFSVSRPVSFWSWAKVLGFRTPIFRATSAISSVTSPARPQYSGSFPVTPPSLAGTRSVIIRPSLTIFSRGWSVRGIWKESLLSSRGMLDLVCFPIFVFPPITIRITVRGTAASRVFFRIVAKAVRMREYWPDAFLQGPTRPLKSLSASLSFAAFDLCR